MLKVTMCRESEREWLMDWGHKENFWEEVSLGLGLKDGNNLII